MAGLDVNAGVINSAVAGISQRLFSAFEDVRRVKAFLDGYSVATLESVFNLNQTDGNIIKSAFGDLDDLAKVWNNQASAHLGGSFPYQQFAVKLLGVGLY